MKLSGNSNKRGFTLVETVIAMGIITIMITAFLAAFGPAVQGIRKSISAKEANRLASTLEAELSVLRPDEAKAGGGSTNGYGTAFEKAFTWIEGSDGSDQNNMVLIYQYRGDIQATPNEDGTLKPFKRKDTKALAGKDYVIQSVVRRFNDPEVQEELQARVVEGRVFYVKMTQLVYHNDALTVAGSDGAPGGPGSIVSPNPPNASATYENYPEAVIAFQAQFYVMKSSLYPYIQNTYDLAKPGKPVFTRNMAVRR